MGARRLLRTGEVETSTVEFMKKLTAAEGNQSSSGDETRCANCTHVHEA